YKTTVTKLLDKQIAPNPVGQVILKAIAQATSLTGKKWWTMIVPFEGEDYKDFGDCNAGTRARDEDGANVKGYKYYLGKLNDPETKGDDREDESETYGTGEGTDVEVHFSPEMFGKGGCGGGLYSSEPDEVLLHELVHALRDMKGLKNRAPTYGKLLSYLNYE